MGLGLPPGMALITGPRGGDECALVWQEEVSVLVARPGVCPLHTPSAQGPSGPAPGRSRCAEERGWGRCWASEGLGAAGHPSLGPFSPRRQVRLGEESARSAPRKNGGVGEAPPKVAPLSCGSGSIFPVEPLLPPPLVWRTLPGGRVCAGSWPWLPLISYPTPCCRHHLPPPRFAAVFLSDSVVTITVTGHTHSRGHASQGWGYTVGTTEGPFTSELSPAGRDGQ